MQNSYISQQPNLPQWDQSNIMNVTNSHNHMTIHDVTKEEISAIRPYCSDQPSLTQVSTDEYLEVSAQDAKQQILEDLQQLREETIEVNRVTNPLDPLESGLLSEQVCFRTKEAEKSVLNQDKIGQILFQS